MMLLCKMSGDLWEAQLSNESGSQGSWCVAEVDSL